MALTLNYDYTQAIVDNEKWLQWREKRQSVWQAVQDLKEAGELGFAALPFDEQAAHDAIALASEVAVEFESVIIIGIGGSDLGARAVHRALNHQFYNLNEDARNGNPQLFFAGDTTDPVALQEVLDVVNIETTAVVVISKSGNTIEQMSTFLYVRSLLPDPQQQVIVLTDPETGSLRKMVEEEGYRSLPIPPNVGGRFSVLSSVGLFPLALAGVDVLELLRGAAAIERQDGVSAEASAAFAYALLGGYMAQETGRDIHVFMPYAYGLREIGFWFRQLYAESLGKAVNRQGETVETGITPIAAIGPTDQHSQVQLYMEGPHDKFFTFVTADDDRADLTVPDSEEPAVAYLGGTSFSRILATEAAATAYALAEVKRPSCRIHLDNVDAYHVGQLLQLLELSVTYLGEFYDIDAFNQPGVELGKEYMYGELGREGFEERTLPDQPARHQVVAD